MNNNSEVVLLQAKKKHLKLMAVMMLVFVFAGPFLGPKIFADQFSQLRGFGRYFIYISTPIAFAMLSLFYLLLYRRADLRLRKLGR